ncbi:MAG: cupredoxin domain-containing protein, partial [Candidatus Humimicrobiaceae bacterium]
MRNNKKFLIVCVFCITAVIIFSLVSCGGSASQSTKTIQVSSSTVTSNPNQVICKNNKFQPDILTVKVGTTVTWINQDS